MTICTNDPDRLPSMPGAYLLLIRLEKTAALPGSLREPLLPQGRYIYAGSACGHGGIKARCRRHLSRRQLSRTGACRWHVDWLTRSAADVHAIAFPGGNECALIRRLSTRPDIVFPIHGFGSSDCRRCTAHLARLDAVFGFDAIIEDLTADVGVPISSD